MKNCVTVYQFPDAEHQLGLMYYYGYGTKPNKEQAKKWLWLAYD